MYCLQKWVRCQSTFIREKTADIEITQLVGLGLIVYTEPI